MRPPPMPDPDLPAKRLAANQNDRVARWLVQDLCVLSKGLALMLKAYRRWCNANGVVNRMLTTVQLLDHLKEVYGIEHDSALVSRLKSQLAPAYSRRHADSIIDVVRRA